MLTRCAVSAACCDAVSPGEKEGQKKIVGKNEMGNTEKWWPRAAAKLDGHPTRSHHQGQGFALPPRAASAELGWPATAHSTAASWTKKGYDDHQRIHLLSRQDITFTANCSPQIGRTVPTAAWAAWTDRGVPPSGSAP